MKKLYRILTDTNKVRRLYAYNKSEVRLKAYQLYGSENFIIREVK